VKTTFNPKFFEKRFSQKFLLRFVEAQNIKKSLKNFFDTTQNSGLNQNGGFQ
jgi:hypothetical protein